MPHKISLLITGMVTLLITLACTLSGSGAASETTQAAPTQVAPDSSIPSGTLLPLPASSPGTNLSPTPGITATNSRSAGINLIPVDSGTATPNIPPTLAPQAELPLLPVEWYPLYATAGTESFSVTVLGWGITDQTELYKPEPGSNYIWVGASFLNRTSSYRYIYWNEVKLLEESGKAYDLDQNILFRYEKSGVSVLSLAPGEHLRHEFYFAVPENAPELNFQYDNCPSVSEAGGSAACGPSISLPLTKVSTGASLPPELTAQDPDLHPLGEVVSMGSQAFSAVRWEILSPSQYEANATIPAGVNLVRIDLAAANLGKTTWTPDATGAVWVNLKDRTGRYYELESGGFGGDGHLEPGEWGRGTYYFQVPPGAEGLELVIDQAPSLSQLPVIVRTFIGLGDQPALVQSALQQMPGSLAPNAIALGQPAQVSSFQMTVKSIDFPNTSTCSGIPAGFKAVMVTVEGKNTTNSTAQTSTLQSYIKDSTGKAYAACDSKNNTDVYSGLPASESMTVRYSFIIPNIPGDLFLLQCVINSPDPKVFFLLQ